MPFGTTEVGRTQELRLRPKFLRLKDRPFRPSRQTVLHIFGGFCFGQSWTICVLVEFVAIGGIQSVLPRLTTIAF